MTMSSEGGQTGKSTTERRPEWSAALPDPSPQSSDLGAFPQSDLRCMATKSQIGMVDPVAAAHVAADLDVAGGGGGSGGHDGRLKQRLGCWAGVRREA